MKEKNRLKRNVAGLGLGVFQSAAYIAPAAVAASFFVVESSIVGAAVPFTFLLAIIGVSSAMYMNYVFAGRISHAGGYYAYVSAGLGPRFGVFSGWLYFINILGALAGFAVLFFAGVLWPMIPGLATNAYGWIPLAFIPLSIILYILYRGLKPSLVYTMVGSILEVGFLIIVSIIIIIKAGPLNTFIPFTPAGNSIGNLGLATVYAILGFVGVGSVITLSEELKKPKATVKKSIFIALGMTAIVYVLSSYAFVIGWGINNMQGFSVAINPGFIVVNKFLGPVVMIIFVLITLNSFISNGIAEGNAFSRLGFALARDRIIFTKKMAMVHPRYGSPIKVILLEWFIIVALTLIGGLLFGPFMGAAVITTINGAVLYIVHILANISLPIYAKKTLGMKFKRLLPLIFGPLLATIVYVFAVYGVFFPIPTYPLNIASYSIIAIVIIGVIFGYIFTRNRSKEELSSIGKDQLSEE